MPKVEIMLQAPDAEALAQEFVNQAGADSGASVQRLPTPTARAAWWTSIPCGTLFSRGWPARAWRPP
jgi:hypothetical protein